MDHHVHYKISRPPLNNFRQRKYQLSSTDSFRYRQRLRQMQRHAARGSSKVPFNRRLYLRSRYEACRTSLFFSPLLAVFFAIGAGVACSYVDNYLTEQGLEPPGFLMTSVDSARSLLSIVASATISFAGTAFSVSLLVIQLGSSQYSPRIVHTLFRDPFSRRIMAIVVGTFTYCLVVMRTVDEPLGEGETGQQVVPNVSVAVAFVSGIVSLLSIVAFIDHSAKTMDVSQLLRRVARDTVFHIQQTWEEEDFGEENKSEQNNHEESDETKSNLKEGEKTVLDSKQQDSDQGHSSNDENYEENPKKPQTKKGVESLAEKYGHCHVVRFRTSGWIQEIDFALLEDLVPENGAIKLHTMVGRYAIPGTAVCSVYPKPQVRNSDKNASRGKTNDDDNDDDEIQVLKEFDDEALDAIFIGSSRTIRSDATYGLRQLVDVVLRALSPGVNDPTTAQDGIFQAAAVVTEFLHRVPPKSVFETENGGKLILNEQQDYDSIVRLAFDEARVCAASSPTVGLYILESLRLIRESLNGRGYSNRAPEIERQARLVMEGVKNASHIQEDNRFIVKAHRERFATSIALEDAGICDISADIVA